MKKLLKKLLHRIPTSLPQGKTQFEEFCLDILETNNLPLLPSYNHAIATMIMNLPPQQNKESKHKFAKAVHKSMANQVAYEMIRELQAKDKQ